MRKGRRMPLPPSGISVWTPLSSSGSGLIAILGAGATEGLTVTSEDVPCVWCGLRSPRAAACEVCGSPLYESFSVWQSVPTVGNRRGRPDASKQAEETCPGHAG